MAHSVWPHTHLSDEAQTLCLHRLPCPCPQVVSQHLLLLLFLQARSQWEAGELPEPSQEPCEKAKRGYELGVLSPIAAQEAPFCTPGASTISLPHLSTLWCLCPAPILPCT